MSSTWLYSRPLPSPRPLTRDVPATELSTHPTSTLSTTSSAISPVVIPSTEGQSTASPKSTRVPGTVPWGQRTPTARAAPRSAAPKSAQIGLWVLPFAEIARRYERQPVTGERSTYRAVTKCYHSHVATVGRWRGSRRTSSGSALRHNESPLSTSPEPSGCWQQARTGRDRRPARDRADGFGLQIVCKRQRGVMGVDEIELPLFAKGLTTGRSARTLRSSRRGTGPRPTLPAPGGRKFQPLLTVDALPFSGGEPANLQIQHRCCLDLGQLEGAHEPTRGLIRICCGGHDRDHHFMTVEGDHEDPEAFQRSASSLGVWCP